MLKPTKQHQCFIQYGERLPHDAVSLAYFRLPKPSPEENVHISDTSSFILENIEQRTEDHVFCVNSKQQLVSLGPLSSLSQSISNCNLTLDGLLISDRVETENFMVTDVWKDNQPLYYSHVLSNPIYDTQGPDNNGYYQGHGINVVNHNGIALRHPFLWRVKLKEVPGRTDYYYAHIYTSFRSNLGNNFKVIYTAQVFDGDKIESLPGYSELLNPQPAFVRHDNIADCLIDLTGDFYYSSLAPELGSSYVYVPRRWSADTREHYDFEWRGVLTVIDEQGVEHVCYTDFYKDRVFASNTLLPHEKAISYHNGRKKLTTVPLRVLLDSKAKETIPEAALLTGKKRYSVESTNPSVLSQTRIDGTGLVYGWVDTIGSKTEIPEMYVPVPITEIVDGVEETKMAYSPLFSVRLLDRKSIRVMPPIGTDPLDSWYLRLQNGWFSKTITTSDNQSTTYFYFLPEYYKQDFNTTYQRPVRDITNETPEIIGSSTLKVRHSPLYVDVDDEYHPVNLTVTINEASVPIVGWNFSEGTIEVIGPIRSTDSIRVDYCYTETCYTYRGYWDEENRRYWYLDINPRAGHVCTILDQVDGEIKDVPSFALINKTIYIYLKPIGSLDASGHLQASGNNSAVFHAFEEVSDPLALLLAKVYVRSNTVIDSVEMVDTRVRGGGLKPEIKEQIRKDIAPESEFYWDIGYWDGKPYPENAALVVRLPKSLLREHGGRFTREEIENIVEEHIAYGIFYIIKFEEDAS